MKEQVENYISKLLVEEQFPDATMERATRFLRVGDLRQLMDLPLSPDAMIQVGSVLQIPSSNGQVLTSLGSVPTLSEAVRRKLRVLVDECGEYTEAALFVLSKDLQARALNHLHTEDDA